MPFSLCLLMSVLLHSVLMISGILAHRYLGYTKILYFFGNCRLWNKGRYLPPSSLASLGASRCPKQCLDGYVRRHDQDGYLWLYTILFFEFLTPCPPWWGIVILIIGASSTILGVLYALMQHDMKTLLAYHSIENIGIILIGIGLSMIFKSYNLMALSSLAMIAGLYHVINHAVFKCLLFGCAGNIYYSTHTNNIEEFGG